MCWKYDSNIRLVIIEINNITYIESIFGLAYNSQFILQSGLKIINETIVVSIHHVMSSFLSLFVFDPFIC